MTGRSTRLSGRTTAPAIPHMSVLELLRGFVARLGAARRGSARVPRAREGRVAQQARVVVREFLREPLDGERRAYAPAARAAHPRELLAVARQHRERLGDCLAVARR